MFDLSFPETIVICIGALAVMKPEEIPGAARKLGRLLGRLRSFKAEWSGHLENAAHKLEREIDAPLSGASDPLAEPIKGGLTGYRPEGSDQVYERYVDDLAAEQERTLQEGGLGAPIHPETRTHQTTLPEARKAPEEQPLVVGKEEEKRVLDDDTPTPHAKNEEAYAQAEQRFVPSPPCEP